MGIEKIGLEKGKIEGEIECKFQIAKRLLAEKFELPFIAKLTELPLQKIEELQKNLSEKQGGKIMPVEQIGLDEV